MPEMDTRLVIPRFIYKVFHKMSRKCFRNKCRCDTKCFVILSCAWCVLVIAFSVTQTSHSVPSGRQSHKAFSQDIHQLTPQTCVHPELFVDDPVMNTFLIRHPPAVCNGTENWVYTQNGAVHILPQILETYRDLLCDYFPLQRHGDYSVTWGEPFINITSGFLMTSDFFRVVCKVKGQVLYDRAHAGVAYTADRIVRQEDPLTEGFGGLGIAILGFDSMSRMSWLRRLNKTRQYFHDVLGAVELMHHNIVGDGTTAVMLPMLTGKFEWELPECRRNFSDATTLDRFPFLWHAMKKAGYLTSWANADPMSAPFNYRMMGFEHQPTDFYTRPFFLAIHNSSEEDGPFCIGPQTKSQVWLDYFRDIFLMYRERRKFLVHFLVDLSHDDNNSITMIIQFKLTFPTVTNDVIREYFSLHEKEISRVNRYGDDPACILNENRDIRQYCFCKSNTRSTY